MIQILLIGANGQLGREIRDLAPMFPDFKFLYAGSADLDITNQSAVHKFFSENKFDYVINCAAYTAVDQAEKDREAAWLLNAKAPGILAENCFKYNARFIHISTDYVFNGKNFRPYLENDEVSPVSFYGKTKMEGEQAVFNTKCDAMIIRTSWLYSNYGDNFVKTMIRLGKEQDELGVVFDQVGSPTYAYDLASTILQIISKCENKEKQFLPGIYHYSNEGVCSWYDFTLAIHEMAGIECDVRPIESREYPVQAPRPCYCVLNKSKIKVTFGVQIPHWRVSLKKCMDKH